MKNTGLLPGVFFLLFSSNVLQGSLIISQYIETNSGTTPKGVELWNVSGSTIDFSSNNLVIKKGVNGGTPSTDYTLSVGTLFNGGVIVVGTSGDLATATTNNGGTHYTEGFTFNGDDALEIYLSGTLTDMFGVSGSDPGTYWSGSGVSTKNQNIQLKSGIWTGDIDGWTDPSTRFETVSTTPVSNQTGFGIAPGVLIAGDSGFRMMSSPVPDQIYSDLLAELWTQGMTGADVTGGDANVWKFDVANQSFTSSAITDISGSGGGESLTAGQGFLVYIFSDTDNSGDDDLPVSLSVSGTVNSSSATVPSSGSVDDGEYALAGNPYAQTIDWDDVTKSNITSTVYVYDDAKSGGAGWINWNGTSGDLSNGLIAPYQGFIITGVGGNGTITIEIEDKASSSGTFYKTMADSTGSMSFTITSGNYSDRAFVSFMTNGAEGMDNADAYKLLPMSPSERVVGISYAEGNGLDISNLPYSHEGSIAIPLDVMYLTLDEDYYFVTNENNVTMDWNVSSLPGHVSLTLTDNATGAVVNLTEENEITFSTEAKGSFLSYGTGGVNIYPQVGESRFTLTVSYSALTSNDEPANVPESFSLHPAYPNPFNPSTTISFDIPEAADRNTSLHIYDITGKLVETLVNKVLSSGSHAVTWDPKNLSSGLYIVQLKVGNKIFRQKLTFLK